MSQSAVKVVWWSYCRISLLPQTTTLVLNSCCVIWASSRLILICFITHFISTFTKAPSVTCRLYLETKSRVTQSLLSRTVHHVESFWFPPTFSGRLPRWPPPQPTTATAASNPWGKIQHEMCSVTKFDKKSFRLRCTDGKFHGKSTFLTDGIFNLTLYFVFYVSISCWLTEMLQCYRHFYKLSSSLIRQPNLKKL